jgi:hydroxymethylglutaryl-CoA reductase
MTGFGRMQRDARLACLAERTGVPRHDVSELLDESPLPFGVADHMVENAVGVVGLPLGVALNFVINGTDRIVPMAIEEPSVIAAASGAARLIREAGGFSAEADRPLMIGQVQLLDVPDAAAAIRALDEAAADLLAAADAVHPNMARRGCGAHAIESRWLPITPRGPMLVVHLLVDVGDAMGANAVNSMVEAIAPRLAELTRGRACLRILSNLADRRLARAAVRIPCALLQTGSWPGRDVAERVVDAWAFAAADPYRAATHNKGIMNGIDAVAIATGQDWRGIEAGAHAYAARAGQYGPLSEWRVEDDALCGRIELPLAAGTVGGNLECNPRVRLALRLLGSPSARDLAAVMAAAGLGQNLAALRALVTDGIQRGHLALHARGLVMAAGAPEALADEVVHRLIESGQIKLSKARQLVESARVEGPA